MKALFSSGAALAVAVALATPASAQVSGVGTADPAIIVAGSQALSTAFQQIGTTYQAQRTQLDQLDQQRVALVKKFDTNNDGRLNEAEQKAFKADVAATKQLETLEQQSATLQGPMNLAAAYAVSQIADQLAPTVQQVVSQGGIQLILPSNSVLYAVDAANLNQKLTTALNARLPSVSITPPANWQPDQQTIQLLQDVQQVRVAAAQAMAQQQQQQARGTTPAPTAAKPTAGAKAPVKGR